MTVRLYWMKWARYRWRALRRSTRPGRGVWLVAFALVAIAATTGSASAATPSCGKGATRISTTPPSTLRPVLERGGLRVEWAGRSKGFPTYVARSSGSTRRLVRYAIGGGSRRETIESALWLRENVLGVRDDMVAEVRGCSPGWRVRYLDARAFGTWLVVTFEGRRG